MGVEITNYIYPNPWVALDLDLSFSRARFLDVPEGEDFVPGALNRVISAGIAVNPPAGVRAGPFGSFRLRHFGPRPLHRGQQRQVEVDDDRQRRGRLQVLRAGPADCSKASTCSTPRCRTSTTSSSRACATSRSRSRTFTSTPRFRARPACRCRCPSSRRRRDPPSYATRPASA